MRTSLLFLAVALVACELEPAPKKAPPAQGAAAGSGAPAAGSAAPTPPPQPTQPTQPMQPSTPPPAAVDAGVDAPMEVKQACVDTGAHLAQVLIDEAKDATQKAAIEQDKARMIRRVAEVCTRDNWKPEALACFMKATSSEQMDVCAKDLTLKD